MSKAVPVVPIELDQERHLRFDFNAIRLIEEKTGKNALKQETWDNLNGTELVIVVWAGLQWEDKGLTIDSVGSMIHPGNANEVTDRLMQAWGKSMPKPGPEETQDPLA